MKKIEDFGVFVPKVLLPANIDLEKCDMFARQRENILHTIKK